MNLPSQKLEKPAKAVVNWHALDKSDVLRHLSGSESGLTTAEAKERLEKFGFNQMKEVKKISPFTIFLRQFNSLIIWILIGAGLISGFLGDMIDCIAIFSIVFLNAIISFYQEFKAEKSIAALKKMTSPHAKVWRNGAVTIVEASQIVPADILELEAGDVVAADARLLEASSLKCIEAALTGESDAVLKSNSKLNQDEVPLADRENMIYMGTSVASGSGRAIVVATAMGTEIGRISRLIQEAGDDDTTPLQKKLESFGRVLVWVSLAIVFLLFILGLLRGTPFIEMLMTAVSLAVAAVPEGLPAIVTIAFSLGVMRMSRRRALIRKLPAVETLGSTTVICTDKTGTLTVGEMTVRALYVAENDFEISGNGYEPKGEVSVNGSPIVQGQSKALSEMVNILIGCNNSHLVQEDNVWKVIGDPTEGAMFSAGIKAGGNIEKLDIDMPKIHEIPFDSDRKFHSVIRQKLEGKWRVYVNGAPDLLLSQCAEILSDTGVSEMIDAKRSVLLEKNSDMANKALRVLGSAYREMSPIEPSEITPEKIEKDLVFVGLTGMYDPPRPEVKDAIKECRSAGIRVVMITGDQPHTALAIARELGIATSTDVAISSAELNTMSDKDLQEKVSEIAVYARVTAENKLQIVRAWRANDAVVAMTGDGVNDAPAIKGADIGIAMGQSGTEVTKKAADMIITDDNFTSIVSAIEEGRGIYNNIRKTLQYLLAGNVGEILLMSICVIIGLPSPLLPIHLLWINLVTDGLPALCLATDPIDSEVMTQSPRARSERITDGDFVSTMLLTGVLTAGVSFGVYFYNLKTSAPEIARAYAFTVLVFAELFRSFGARSATKSIWQINIFSNFKLLIVVAISIGIQILSHQNAMLAKFFKTSILSISDILMLILVSLIPMLVIECVKWIKRKVNGDAKTLEK